MLQEYRTILVPVDYSKESERALKKAANVALRNHAKLIITHVIDGQSFASANAYIDSVIVDDAVTIAKERLAAYCELARSIGDITVESHIAFGAPKHMIAKDLVKTFDVDLIMMGATGLTAVERLLLGSVSTYVSQHALCDVLLVRTD